MKPSRRTVLTGAAGAALAGCGRRPRTPAAVSIVRAKSYSEDLLSLVRRLIADHKLDVRGKRVLLKPNLVEFDPSTTINTHPALVAAALEAFRAAGAAQVRIAEGPGHRRNTLELAEAAGYFEAIRDFERLFTDLNTDDAERVPVRHANSRMDAVYLPRTALGCDLLVSLPKMKCHHWVGATLSMKNLFGTVPGAVYGWPKNVLHWAGINECIADLNALLPKGFAIVDGIVGMEGNGPIQGTPKFAGVLVAGTDRVAVDATCCRVMRIDPRPIPYLQLAGDNGQTEEANVRQIAEPIRAVETEFALIELFRSLRLKRA
jgi:uncharacterized protein (DUF362 family)